MYDDLTRLPMSTLTIEDARRKLAGLHFAQESLSTGERQILHIAEALLRLVDAERTNPVLIAAAIAQEGVSEVSLLDDRVLVWTHRHDTNPTAFPGHYSHNDIAALVAQTPGVTFVDNRSRYQHHIRNSITAPPR